MSHHFLMIVASYVRYVSIQILLKFQPSISYRVGFCPSKTGFGQGSGQNLVLTTGQNLDKTWTKLGYNGYIQV